MANYYNKDLMEIFNTIGGSINEEDDSKVTQAIMENPINAEEKIGFLVIYCRELEREQQRINRSNAQKTVLKQKRGTK